MPEIEHPEDIDRLLGWKPGTAERLARRRQLPYILLPDGSIRFDRAEIEALIVHVRAVPAFATESRHDVTAPP